MNPYEVIARHYDPRSDAYRILVTHSVLVARKAIEIARELEKRAAAGPIDLGFLEEAALLHDIGIRACHAPEYGCLGSEPYIRHGIEGRRILEAEGLPRHALVCVRHTGAGITSREIREQGLPLPEEDYLPVSLEEKVILVADKFYSKKPGALWKEKRIEKIDRALERHGPAAAARWRALRREILGLKDGPGGP